MRLMAQTPLVPAPTSLGSNFESSGGGRKHTTSPRSGLLSLMDTLSRMKRSPTLNVGCMDSDGMCLASATYSRSAYAPPNMDPSSSVAPAARRPREVVHRGERGVIATLVASKTAIISFSDSDASPLFTHTRVSRVVVEVGPPTNSFTSTQKSVTSYPRNLELSPVAFHLRARTGPPRAEERANPSVGLETRARAQGAMHICLMTCRSVRMTRASTCVCYPHG